MMRERITGADGGAAAVPADTFGLRVNVALPGADMWPGGAWSRFAIGFSWALPRKRVFLSRADCCYPFGKQTGEPEQWQLRRPIRSSSVPARPAWR